MTRSAQRAPGCHPAILPGVHERLAPGVIQIDTELGGWGEMTAGYLVEGPEPCLKQTDHNLEPTAWSQLV